MHLSVVETSFRDILAKQRRNEFDGADCEFRSTTHYPNSAFSHSFNARTESTRRISKRSNGLCAELTFTSAFSQVLKQPWRPLLVHAVMAFATMPRPFPPAFHTNLRDIGDVGDIVVDRPGVPRHRRKMLIVHGLPHSCQASDSAAGHPPVRLGSFAPEDAAQYSAFYAPSSLNGYPRIIQW